MDSYRIFHADPHLRTPNSSFWTRKTSNSMKITELGNSEFGRRGPELGRRGPELSRRGPELGRRGRQSGGRWCSSDLPSTRAGSQDDVSLTNSLK